MKQPVVPDSFALISFFHQEPGWETVRSVFKELTGAGEKAVLSRIKWGEFYYIVKRRVGREKTLDALALIEQLPILKRQRSFCWFSIWQVALCSTLPAITKF